MFYFLKSRYQPLAIITLIYNCPKNCPLFIRNNCLYSITVDPCFMGISIKYAYRLIYH